MHKELTDEELHTYSRQVVLADIGYDGQLALKNARVCLVGAGGLGSIATVLLSRLKEAGATYDAQQGKSPAVQTSDPKQMSADEVAAMARYAQQNHPDAFGKAAADIGQKQPALLHGFLGKAALAVAAAALASHFIKPDRK